MFRFLFYCIIIVPLWAKVVNMKLFLGTFKYSLDEKNRLRIPNNFKKLLENNLIITLMDSNELSLMNASHFDTQINEMLNANSNSRKKQREC